MKTFSIPGGLAGPPSACSCAANRVDVFAVGPGSTVWRWSWNGTSWSPPGPLPGGLGVIPPEGVCAVSSGPGCVEVFAVEAGSRTPVWWRGNDTGWLPGPTLPGGPTFPAVPVAAVCASPNNIDVFAVGAGGANTPWWWHWDGAHWTAPLPLAGANLPAERIAAVSAGPGLLQVFAAGPSNHLWHWRKVGTGPWSVAEDLGGDLPAEGVSAVSWGPNRTDVFAASRAPGNPLQHWWSEGAGFAGPENLGGNLAAGTVSAVSSAANRLDVFGVSGDQRIAHWQWDGQIWTGPNHYGDHVPAGDLSAVERVWPSFRPDLPARRRLDVFVAGAGNTLRQWPGGGLENATTQPWSNWPTNQATNPAGHAWPDSLEELVNVVKDAERSGSSVRAVGSSWSNSDVAVTPAYVVETDRLNGVLTDVLSTSLNPLGSGLRLVHVEAGIKLYQLNDFLDSRNLALKTMGGSSGQSLAGVLSTSAHGMDIDRGPIPDMVRAIHLVGPGGVQHWIEPSAGITNSDAVASVLNLPPENLHYDDDWFNSALVSVGSLGIIYSVIVEVVPQYDLISKCEALDWTAAKARLRGGPGDPFATNPTDPTKLINRGVQVVVEPYMRADGSRVCYFTTRTEAASDPNQWVGGGSSTPSWLVTAFTWALVGELTPRTGRVLLPSTVNELTGENQVGSSPMVTKRGLGHTIMGGPDPGGVRGLTVEAVFDATPPNTRYLDFVDSALEILRAAFAEVDMRGYLGWISLRFQGPSRAYLSPQYSVDPKHRSATVEFAAFYRIPEVGLGWPDTDVLLGRIESEVRNFGGVQHWGLNNGMNATDVARAFPRLDTWRRVRWELTKSGTISTFDSPFTRRCGLSDPPLAPITADYDNDGMTDFAVWRPSSGTWFVIDSSTGVQRTRQWGAAGDVPVPGRYVSAKSADFAFWRPSTGTWNVIDGSTGKKRPAQQLGQLGDIPVPGDYSGDGRTDLAVWRPSTGTWNVIDSSTGKKRPAQQLGQLGDIPVPGDYDGDGRTDLAVWRPSTGTWFVIDSSTGKPRSPQQWGQLGDIPVPGDYDGDGRTDFAVWRPSTGTWYVIESSSGDTRAVQFGQAGDIPVPGRYDADKKTDFAFWRPSTGTWYVLESSTGQERSQRWGQGGDIPV